METSVLAVSQQATVAPFIPQDWHEYHHSNGLRNVKKQMRHQKPSLVLLCIGSTDDEQLGKDVAEYVRKGLSNFDTRVVLLRDAAVDLDESLWMEQYQINACLVAGEEKALLNKSVLNRELATFNYIENNHRQHDAETDMLMCITKFSRADENLSELLREFSLTLSELCHSACCFHIRTKSTGQWVLDFCDTEEAEVVDAIKPLVMSDSAPECLTQALDEKNPQINLLQNDQGLETVTEKLPVTIGSYLTFPIVVYEHVIYLLVYLIPEEDMDKVSMKQINIINKAAEQLTILLERKRAESSLKKQYQRLKSTLLELKSAKQELVHNEKMASIGRMAAGIAHEINNPLSYVISNFSSMDKYLESIMQLQDMQTELLTSIDAQQNQKAQTLKQHISEFEEEADIPFVLEDIRAVVSDSFNGLQRVKNIISDLKSFTHSQDTQLEACDLQKIIDDTLTIFKYDTQDHITIEQSIASCENFMSHSGLMGQVFTNLIKNSIQAMQAAQTENPTITISATRNNNTIDISVRDNGPGIDEQGMKKIFDPFYTTKTVGEGTGLGLSVTFNIIKKLGGTVECRSELGEYTEFFMQFSQPV